MAVTTLKQSLSQPSYDKPDGSTVMLATDRCRNTVHGVARPVVVEGMLLCRHCLTNLDWQRYFVKQHFRPDQFGWHLQREGLVDDTGQVRLDWDNESFSKYYHAMRRFFA